MEGTKKKKRKEKKTKEREQDYGSERIRSERKKIKFFFSFLTGSAVAVQRDGERRMVVVYVVPGGVYSLGRA